jgi:hypothetical protein
MDAGQGTSQRQFIIMPPLQRLLKIGLAVG